MIIRFVLGVFFLALTLIGGIFLYGILSIRHAIPEYSGEIQLDSLKRPIIISRDSFAIAHIEAQTDEDAYYGLGYVHAQERLSQMDLTRRIGYGRMSELLGERTLLIDKWAHTIGFARIAEEMWKVTSQMTKKYLIAYSNGVNAYIKTHSGKLGFEFDALHYEPDLWKPQDCLIIGRLMSWEMNFSYWTDAAFSDIALKLDAEHLKALMPDYDGPTVLEGNVTTRPVFFSTPKRDSTKVDSLGKRDSASQTSTNHTSKLSTANDVTLAGLWGINLGAGGGSNSFVVSPKRTASGGAMLENDMHLALGSPARFHLSHIRSKEGLNVAGFCVPGLPIFISGRNENLSWGVTNGMIDETDYFILTPDGKNYRTSSGTKSFTTIVENIIVKTDDPDAPKIIPYTITLSEYGPIVNDLSTFELGKVFLNNSKRSVCPKSETVLGKNEMVAVQWNGFKATSDEIGSFFMLHKAANATDHTFMDSFATPCLNLCLADREGNISYQLIGRIPRRAGNEERVLLPRRADNPEDAWMEDMTTRSLPSLSNPDEGFIISANNPSTVHRNIPHSNNWEPSGRAERLRQLLQLYTKLDLAHAKQVMTDVSSPFEKYILAGNILRVMRTKQKNIATKYNNTTEEALQYLENWDGRQSEIDVATTICNVFLLRLCVDALSDDLGAELFNEYLYINNVPVRTMSNMLRDEYNILWDDIRTAQIESRDTIIRRAFVESIHELTKMFSSDTRGWNWGKLHSLTYRHPFSQASDVVGNIADIPSGYAAGGLTTVVQASYSFWKPFAQRVGPSMRMLTDMKTNIMYAILPTGNSGNIYSPHYGDMAALFKRGELIPVSLDSRSESWKTLKLIPKE